MKQTHGGSRPNAGRKTKEDKKQPHSVRVYKKDHDRIVKRYTSLQKFIDKQIEKI